MFIGGFTKIGHFLSPDIRCSMSSVKSNDSPGIEASSIDQDELHLVMHLLDVAGTDLRL